MRVAHFCKILSQGQRQVWPKKHWTKITNYVCLYQVLVATIIYVPVAIIIYAPLASYVCTRCLLQPGRWHYHPSYLQRGFVASVWLLVWLAIAAVFVSSVWQWAISVWFIRGWSWLFIDSFGLSVCLVHQCGLVSQWPPSWKRMTLKQFQRVKIRIISESQNQNYFRESKSEWLKLEDGSKVSATAAETAEYVRSHLF